MQSKPRKTPVRAFTLVEVMLSLALTTLLILTISRIFSSAAKTVGSGFALGDAVRSQKAISQSLRLDIEGTPAVVPSGMLPTVETPCIIVYNERTAAFKDTAEEQGDRDYDPTGTAAARDTAVRTFDSANSGTESATVPTYRYGFRNWRTDSFSFFSNGNFPRQTNVSTTPGTFVANFQTSQAWIWYGHLKLYNGVGAINVAASYPVLGAPNLPASPNANNRLASQWAIGRAAILMTDYYDIDSVTAGNQFGVLDNSGTAQVFLKPEWVRTGAQQDVLFPTKSDTSLTPLTFGSSNYVYGTYVPSSVQVAANSMKIEDYRCDLAGVSVSNYRTRLKEVVNPLRTNPNASWYQDLFASNGTRFYGNSYPNTLNDKGIAETAQYLTGGCLQFIVEFAGDFVTQNPATGALTAAAPDGIIDFSIEATTNNRSIRWYGLPRDSNGDGAIATALPHQSVDVMPVRDLAGAQQPFEKRVPDAAVGSPADYLKTNASTGNKTYAVAFSPLDLDPTLRTAANSYGGYTAVDTAIRKPSLFRVTVQLADKNGRLADGFTQEYVFKCP